MIATSPGLTTGLQSATGGARLIPESRFLRTGLPRRLPRGECAEAPFMVATSDPSFPAMPAPEVGEALALYIRRTIAESPEFRRFMTSARSHRFDLSTPWWFRPAFVTPAAVTSFYDVFARSELDPRVDGFGRLLNHLLVGRNPRALPLDLRMVDVPVPDLGEKPVAEDGPRHGQDVALRLASQAGRFRDERLALLCESLRSGAWSASGFTPGDHQRTMVPIPAVWWADEFLECNWQKGELKPHLAEDTGRPTFLGLIVSPALARTENVTMRATGPSPAAATKRLPSAKLIMRQALTELLQERNGQPYKLKAEAYRDVLSRLGIRGERRGYSIDTFSRACVDLLDDGAL